MAISSAARALRRVPDIAALLGDAGLFVANAGEVGDALADLVLGRRAKAQPQPRLGGIAIARPFRPVVKRDAGIERRLHELSHIDLVRQLYPQEDAAFGGPWLDRGAE